MYVFMYVYMYACMMYVCICTKSYLWAYVIIVLYKCKLVPIKGLRKSIYKYLQTLLVLKAFVKN